MSKEDETALLLLLFDIVYAVQPKSADELNKDQIELFINEEGKQVIDLVNSIIKKSLKAEQVSSEKTEQ